jgi:hypothetical protein
MFKLPVRDLLAQKVLAEEIIRDGRRRGLPLSPQHLRLLEALLAAYGAVGTQALGRAIGSRSKRPSEVLRTRVPPLRKAVEPYGYRINAHRNLGYGLVLL